MSSTVDFTELSAKHTGEASKRRLRARYWAEMRLKAYGIIAIAIAAAALLLLLSTVVTKTAGVIYEKYITLEATIEVSDRDRERLADQNPRMRANLRRVVQGAIATAIPGEIGRRESRQATSIVSGDAGLFLGDRVKADLGLIGQTVQFDALLDDNMQLYLKGVVGRPEEIESAGTLSISVPDEDGFVTASFDPSDLGPIFEAIREQRANDAERARAEQRRQQNAVDVTERQLLEAETDEERAELQSRLDSFVFARDRAETNADELMRLATIIGDGVRYTLAETDPSLLMRAGPGWLKLTEVERGEAKGLIYLPLSDTAPVATEFAEGEWQAFIMERPEATRLQTDRQVVWMENFEDRGLIKEVLNTRILSSSDSASAELDGIWGAVVGSFWTMIVTFLLAFPLGVMASIYLEEFAPKNRVTDLIEVNINNLAAVPSIVFGLLGLAIFVSGVPVNIFGYEFTIGGFLPRSSPLAGGAVLALMTLPTIIIAGRASIRAVPPSIRDAALGLGASKLQTATHHVLPLAMPGILTGSIIGMAQALGETAPLLLVGMNSFIQEPPSDPLSPGNVLPTLIYQWNSNSERLFDDKTAAAISILLIFLVLMNALAVLLRKRFERRW
ncbi:MAG: phosphate ABC transporter permease PstA [Pseudomonadota bacterium]